MDTIGSSLCGRAGRSRSSACGLGSSACGVGSSACELELLEAVKPLHHREDELALVHDLERGDSTDEAQMCRLGRCDLMGRFDLGADQGGRKHEYLRREVPTRHERLAKVPRGFGLRLELDAISDLAGGRSAAALVGMAALHRPVPFAPCEERAKELAYSGGIPREPASTRLVNDLALRDMHALGTREHFHSARLRAQLWNGRERTWEQCVQL